MAVQSTPLLPLDGRVLIQFAPVGQTNNPSAQIILDNNSTVQSYSVIEEPINSWKTAVHSFQATSRRFVDDILSPIMIQGQTVMWRFGVVAGTQATWRPWEEHIITQYRASFTPDTTSGPMVTIKTADKLWLMFQNSRLRAHHGLISDIVANIWNIYQGASQAIEATIHPGLSNGAGLYYQSYETDYDFIVDQLLPRSQNQSGTAAYRFYVKDDSLHFHSPGYAAGGLKSLAYSRGSPGFKMLVVSDRSLELSAAGGAGTRTLVVDPLKGTTDVLEADPARLVKFANSRGEVVNFSYFAGHVGLNQVSDEDAVNQALYGSLNAEQYSVEFSSSKYLDLRVGDVLDLALAGGDSRIKLHSGTWLVNKAVHEITSGAMESRFVINRGEFNADSPTTVQGPEDDNQAVVAVGIDIQNLLMAPSADASSGTTVSGPED